ncbi:MAG: hypothetical protein LBT66_00680 [Methanobrevibacter sp.]|nr:hypothetical protein [Candidatus Methanovirga meridionalis]
MLKKILVICLIATLAISVSSVSAEKQGNEYLTVHVGETKSLHLHSLNIKVIKVVPINDANKFVKVNSALDPYNKDVRIDFKGLKPTLTFFKENSTADFKVSTNFYTSSIVHVTVLPDEIFKPF